MTIASICHHDVVALDRDATVLQAAKLMRQHHVGSVFVTESKSGKTLPVGIVTDRDLVVEVLAPELDAAVITVGDIMQAGLLKIDEQAGVFDAIRLMSGKGVRRLPVVKKEGDLIGVITMDDLMLMLSGEFCSFAKLLEKEQHNEIAKRR
jgi:CBS domain-containing protein